MLLFSLSIVFPLLASSVSAVNDVIPHAHGANDTSPVDMYQGTVTLFTPDLVPLLLVTGKSVEMTDPDFCW